MPSPKTDLSSRRRFHHSAVQTGPHSGLDFGPMGDTHHFNAQPPLGLPMWRCVCLCVCLCVCCDCVLLAAEFGKWCGPCPSISETPAASLHVHGQPSYPVASRPLEHCLQIYLKLLVNMPKIRASKLLVNMPEIRGFTVQSSFLLRPVKAPVQGLPVSAWRRTRNSCHQADCHRPHEYQ